MLSLNLRQTIVLIFLFVVVSTGLIMLDSRERMDWLKSPASQLFSPIIWVFNQADDGIGSLGSSNPTEMEAELEAVIQERDELLAENAELRVLEEEVEQLRNQLEFQETFPDLEPVPANVISEDPKGVERILIIDQGRSAGIRTGMAVVSPEFFVGQVTNVDEHRARVTLILDAAAQIGGMLQESGAEGVVYGRWQAGGLIEMRHIEIESALRILPVGQFALWEAGGISPDVPLAYATRSGPRDIVVTRDNRVVGMLWRHELLHHLKGSQRDVYVRDVMDRSVHPAEVGDSVYDVHLWMHDSHRSAVPVVDHGEYRGIFTGDRLAHVYGVVEERNRNWQMGVLLAFWNRLRLVWR
jgi:rod shape-determining protein MreC